MDEHRFLSACPHDCPDTCAMLTTVREGRAISVRGKPGPPLHARRSLRKGQELRRSGLSALTEFCHPLRRKGRKGLGDFESHLLGGCARRDRVTASGRSSPGMVRKPSCRAAIWATRAFSTALVAAIPSSTVSARLVTERTFCSSGANAAYHMVLGMSPGPDPESFVSFPFHFAVGMQRNQYDAPSLAVHCRGEAQGAKGCRDRSVAEPYGGGSGLAYSIRPGTDAALALGLIHVMIEEDLLYRDYIDVSHAGI